MKIIDISLPLYPGMISYPGDPRIEFRHIVKKTSTHTKITLGSHTGTHIDAPSHVFKRAQTIDAISLTKLIGSCRVLDLSRIRGGISVDDLKKLRVKKNERILIKTRNSKRGFKRFYNDFVFLDGDAADYLAKIGIMLFGIDALSVKERGGVDHRAHTSLLKKRIIIIEGLNLSKVRAGTYKLICVPPLFLGLDGSPARALLVK